MSDIKYIIAGDDREHTRFPCLAVVRYAAATVVAVLALAVIAMVIHAMLRSEDIRLSVNDGFIGADSLYTQIFRRTRVSNRDYMPAALAVGGDALPAVGGGVGKRTTTVSNRDLDYGDDPTAYGNNGATNVTLQRANTTNLRVTLIANNPGGRTKIDCNQTNVTLIDITGYEIGTLQLGNFTVQPQTTITLQKRLKIDNATTLSYIWDHHGGAHSFGVTVKVSASVTSYPLGKKTQTKPQTYVCQRVTVGLTDYETYLATDDAECRAAPAPAR